ncbi:unnamed protein product, partial [Rotaria magnacalcarata]
MVTTDTAIIIIDGTYLYIQKSRNNEFQRKTFNLYKKRSLLKPMMIVTTTGYIVACIGQFMSDFNNNDAAIMKDILLRNTDNILSWLKELLEENNLIRRFSLWEIINHTEIIDGFSIMTQDDLGDLTFGVFQLKRARSYAEERYSSTNLTSDVASSVHRCKIIPNLIRIPTQSA